MLCFGLFTAEALSAEAHDDGAPAGALHAGATTTVVAVSAHSTDTPADAPPAVPSGDGHALHVCHCVHGHGAWTPLPGATLLERTIAASRGLPGTGLAPASAHTQPGLRPPII